jgi:maltose O-acetyltransferase
MKGKVRIIMNKINKTNGKSRIVSRGKPRIPIMNGIRYIAFIYMQLLLKISLFPQVRTLFLRLLGAHVGRYSYVFNVEVINGYVSGMFHNLWIGERVFIGDRCLLDLAGKLIIEDEVSIAQDVRIYTHVKVGYDGHPLESVVPHRVGTTRIGTESMISAGVTILQGVTIGERCIVTPNTVVRKDIPSYSIFGAPEGTVIKRMMKK